MKREDINEAALDAYVARVIAQAPPLTDAVDAATFAGLVV
jgi:hypothetical protein